MATGNGFSAQQMCLQAQGCVSGRCGNGNCYLCYGNQQQWNQAATTITTEQLLSYWNKDINKQDMSLSTIAKRLLDADTKTLIKAGFLDTELRLTDKGKAELNAILFEANKTALVVAAQAVIDEAKENK